MPIKVSCVDCGESFQVKNEMAGKRVKCRICAVPVRVPDDVDEESEEDSLPISKKKAKKASAGKRRSADQNAGMATLMIRVGIGVAAALVIGVAVWAINGKMENNRQIAKKNEEINQKNAENAAADAAGAPVMPGMGMPGTTAMPTAGMDASSAMHGANSGTTTGFGGATPDAGMPPTTPMPAIAPVSAMPPTSP